MEHQNEHRMEVRGSKGVSRIEVLDGPTGRRRWPDDLKVRIVAESFQPGARVCDVAAKYGLIARHLSGWRGLARKGQLVMSIDVHHAPGRHGHHAMNILTGFEGILQVDGYTGYDALAEPKRVGGTPLTLAYCWAHFRRKLHDIYQKDGSEIAAEGLRRIAQLYKIEATVRDRPPEERVAAR